MNGHKEISATRVLAPDIKSRVASSGIHLSSSPGRLTADESFDHQSADQDNHTVCERIREAIVADKSLSLYAQNIRILPSPGGVTLCGLVKSHDERKRIEFDVSTVVQAVRVFNKLVVRPSQSPIQPKSPQLKEPDDGPNSEEEAYSRIRRLWGIRAR
jgi:hypothetical protein